MASHVNVNISSTPFRTKKHKPNNRIYAYPLAWTSQFYFCALPFRLDTYSRCNFKCLYCFVIHRGGNFSNNPIYCADISNVKRLIENHHHNGLISDCVQHRLPIHFGGMSEPFCHGELNNKLTYQVLSLLAELEYPTIISTKSYLPAVEPYFSLLKSMPYVAMQFSFSTLDDILARKLEPYAPEPSKRLHAMNKLSEAGIWVSCRFQPFITGASGYIPSLVQKVVDAGVRHIVVEHLKLGLHGTKQTISLLQNCCGEVFSRNYDVHMLRLLGTEYEMLSYNKFDDLVAFWHETRKHNISLGIGDNDFHDLSDSPCCCGIDKLSGFNNWFRHQITSAIWKRDRDNFIRYSSIKDEWFPESSIKRYINSKCRREHSPSTSFRVNEYVKHKWNNPSEIHSPTECVNVTPTDMMDEEGNIIYLYKPQFKFS